MNSLPEPNPGLEPDIAPEPAPELGLEPDVISLPSEIQSEPVEQPLFQSYSQPEFHPPVRMPHLGHVAILAAFALIGFVCASVLVFLALQFHLFGVINRDAAATDIHFTLGSEAVLYVFMLGACLIFFPMIWGKSFFAGIQWNGSVALERRQKLFLIASICFALALINGYLIPSPKNAPIEEMFRVPGAAWLLFAFGVTFAPFFEEMIFRGFLLPAICTACDWTEESIRSRFNLSLSSEAGSFWSTVAMAIVAFVTMGTPIAILYAIIEHHLKLILLILPIAPAIYLGLLTMRQPRAEEFVRPLAANGHPQWSLQAMIVASIATSAPFALMHGAQTGYSWGALCILVGVSLVLCWARLSTRSLAASVFVHASYNFLLFALMLLGTGGFKHFENM